MTSAVENVASLAARAGGSVVRRVRSVVDPSAAAPASGGAPASGWLVVTVFGDRQPDAAELPPPLAELGDEIEVRVRPAADGKGTELAARRRDRPSSGGAVRRLTGTDPQADLRSALRRAKQLLEVGEVLVVDPVPHGDRKSTPSGAVLEAGTKAAPKAGVL